MTDENDLQTNELIVMLAAMSSKKLTGSAVRLPPGGVAVWTERERIEAFRAVREAVDVLFRGLGVGYSTVIDMVDASWKMARHQASIEDTLSKAIETQSLAKHIGSPAVMIETVEDLIEYAKLHPESVSVHEKCKTNTVFTGAVSGMTEDDDGLTVVIEAIGNGKIDHQEFMGFVNDKLKKRR